MYSKKYFLKTLAIFMALNIFTQLVAPTVSMALTSGPTTPEVASFEPVDTTDMVDLVTGDFNYNIPLLEVPGPEGGYPVALSYHGGVLPAQDASWVGLGWNINPGSINRTVNNFADDYCNAKYYIDDQWNGGETTEYNFGIGVGIANIVTVGVDVGVKHDTYRGNGGSVGLSVGVGSQYGLGINASVGEDAWSGTYGSVGIGLGDRAMSVGVTVGSYGGQTYGSFGISSQITQSNMGVSLSSGGLKTSSTIAGVLSGTNDNYGKISTFSGGFGLQIPIYCFYVSVGYKYTRYWMRETSETALYGVLNSKAASDLSSTPYATSSLDCNILYDPGINLTDQKDLDWTTNPVVACYDNYTVLSQGLSGSIEPVMLDNGSFFRKKYNNPDNGNIKMKTDIFRPFTIYKHQFRFRNDFSNSHKITPSGFEVSGSTLSYPSSGMAYTADQLDPRGVIQTLDGSGRPTEKKIAGSRHVEYFTNAEIAAGTAIGFINTPAIPNSERGSRTFTDGTIDVPTSFDVSKNIGGYSITNENGVTYHYALPAYTFQYIQKSVSTNSRTGSIQSRDVSNPNPYAYTWMLTAVTGPDYVDANNNNLADAADWGYWVSFDYGRWTDRFGYRTPDVGVNSDIDGSTSFSRGGKEIYYVNAISTRTHTALFIKESRSDLKGTNAKDYDTYSKSEIYTSAGYSYNNAYNPIKSLKLKEVLLIENSALRSLYYNYPLEVNLIDEMKGYYGTTSDNTAFVNGECNRFISTNLGSGSTNTTYKPAVHWEKMLDANDLNFYISSLTLGESLRNVAVKQVRFQYDNSLCLNTTNSFDTDINTKSGKLTLKAIRFYGRNQVQLLPSTNFKYDLTNPIQGNVQITSVAGVDAGYSDRKGKITCGTNNFSVGDILSFTVNGKIFYATLVKGYGSPNTSYDVIFLGNVLPVAGDKSISVLASQTKNPPYTPEFYDIWGMFKSDYFPNTGVKRNKSRITTDISSKAVDCWSLYSIETPTGAKVNITYEGDDYKNVVLKNKQIYNFKPEISKKKASESTYSPFQRTHSRTWGTESMDFVFEVFEGDLQQPINEVFQVGDKIEIISAGLYQSPVGPWPSVLNTVVKAPVTITAITANTISVRDDNNKILAAPTISPQPTDYSHYFYFHHGAYVLAPDKKLNYGGGLRTKSIETTDGVVSSKTTYEYKNVTNNSSGTTSFDPLCYDELEQLNDYSSSGFSVTIGAAFRSEYSKEYYTAFAKIMAMAKDVVAPGVLYESVKVKNSVTKNGLTTDAPTYKGYQFQAFREDMIGFENISSSTGIQAFTRTTKISDKTSQIGNIISIKTYDKTSRLLSEVSNNYTSTPENDQGILEQVFHEQRRMNPDLGASWENKFASVTVKSQYPSVLVSTTNKDYTKGITTTTNNTAFDFYTGAVTETQTTDSYGNTYMVISDPAYNWYDNDGWPGGMGLKLNSGVNMLTQNSGSYVIKKNASAGAYSVNVTSASTSVAPKQILVTMNGGTKLPLSCHAGTKISGLTLPVFISWISKDRTQFKAISRASSITSDLGARTITMDNGNILKAAVTTWSENWNYRQGSNQYGYSTASIQDYTYFPDQYSYITVDQTKWRIKSSYTWDSPYLNTDGTYPATGMGAFVPFDYSASGAQTSSYWKAVNTNTLYTQYSKLLESKDINNQYTSIKYSEDESLICGTAVNSKYTEFSIGSAEHGEGEFAGYPVSTYAHTGVSSYKLNLNGGRIAYTVKYNEGGEGGFGKGKQYRISAWVYKDNIADAQLFYTSTVNGTSTTTTQNYDATKHIKCGNWILMTMDITTTTAAGTDLKVDVGVRNASTSNYVYTDDFRFQPFVSEVQSYVYDKNTGLLTYVLGSDNRYVRYEYDTRGRLKATYKETTNGEVKMNEYNYNFARPIN